MKKSKLDRVLDKLDKLDERLDSVDKTLVKQEASLSEHIRRTELLEDDLKPVKAHVAQVNGAMKFIGLLSLVLGIIAAIAQFF